MERPIKGGYILISLGLVALSAGASLTVDYERITKTKKHIVLTGIKVADTIMPDVTVKPIFGNGTITFSNIYGFDIVVSSNGSAVVSEIISKSKFYLHTISDGTYTFRIIMNSKTPLDFTTLDTFTKLNDHLKELKPLLFVDSRGHDVYFDDGQGYFGVVEITDKEVISGSYEEWLLLATTDTVTEL